MLYTSTDYLEESERLSKGVLIAASRYHGGDSAA